MGMFTEATRKRKKLRMLLAGPTDAGKTRTALRFAFGIVAHELKQRGENRPPKIWVIDTEHGRASFYKNIADDGVKYDFQVCELNTFNPSTAIAAMKEAWSAGVDALVIDSESHFWEGEDGVLQQHNKFTNARKDKNSYAAWQDATALQTLFIESQLKSPFHVIATVRQKMDAVQERDAAGKTVIRSIGLQDQQRDTFRYEFDVIANISQDHQLTIVKTPWDAMQRGPVEKPGIAFIAPLIDWLNEADGPIEVHSFPSLSPDAAESAAAAVAATEKERLAASVRAAAAAKNETAKFTSQAANPSSAVTESTAASSQTTAATTQSPASQGQAQTASTTGQSDSQTAGSPIFATLEQISEINLILNTLQLKGQPEQIYTSRGITDLAQLKADDAAGIIAKLQPKYAEHRAKQAATANTTVYPASSPAIQQFPDRVGTIDKEDEKRILAGVAKLNIDNVNLQRILGNLGNARPAEGNGVLRSIPDMSFNQGRMILGQIVARVTKEFGNCPF